MKKNKSIIKDYIFIIVGVVLVVAGFYFHKSIISTDRMITAVPHILIYIGIGLFAHFIGNLLQYTSIKNHEEFERQTMIDKNDERNILIANKSKAKAYDLMIYLFATMLIMFSLMGITKFAIIIMVAIYLAIQIYALYWRYNFERTM